MRSSQILLIMWMAGLVVSKEYLACPSIPGLPSLKALFEHYITSLQGNLSDKGSRSPLNVIYFRQRNDSKKPEFVLIFCQRRASQKCEAYIGILVSTSIQSSSDQKPFLSILKYIESDSLPEIKTLLSIKEVGRQNYNCEDESANKFRLANDVQKNGEKNHLMSGGFSEKKSASIVSQPLSLIDTFDNLDDDLDIQPLSHSKEAKKLSGLPLSDTKGLVPQQISAAKKLSSSHSMQQEKPSASSLSVKSPSSDFRSENEAVSRSSVSNLVSKASDDSKNSTLILANKKPDSSFPKDANSDPNSQNASTTGQPSLDKAGLSSSHLQLLSENNDYIQDLYKKYHTLLTDTDLNLPSMLKNSINQNSHGNGHDLRHNMKDVDSNQFSSSNVTLSANKTKLSEFDLHESVKMNPTLSIQLQPKLMDSVNSPSFISAVTEDSMPVVPVNRTQPETNLQTTIPQETRYSTLDLKSNKIEAKEKDKNWTSLYPNLSEITDEISSQPIIGPSNQFGWSKSSLPHADDSFNNNLNPMLTNNHEREADHLMLSQKAKEEAELLQKLYLILAYKQRNNPSDNFGVRNDKVRPTEFLYDNYYSGRVGPNRSIINVAFNMVDFKDPQLSYFSNLSSNDLVKLITQKEQLLSLLKLNQSDSSSHVFSSNLTFKNNIGLNELVGPANRIELPGARVNPLLTKLVPMNQ